MKQDKKLLTQTEIANKLGFSKCNLSKWIKKENVSPVAEEGNKKLFDETLVNRYKEAHKPSEINKSKSFSTVEFLQEQLRQKQKENNELKGRIKELEDQLKGQNSEVISLAHEFFKLADQAQQLNLVDKHPDQLEEKHEEVSSEGVERKQETKQNKGFFAKLFGRS